MGVKSRVEIKLPGSRDNCLPVEIVDWLQEHVGRAYPVRMFNMGQGWGVATIMGGRDMETYTLVFDDPNKAMLFKLTWA